MPRRSCTSRRARASRPSDRRAAGGRRLDLQRDDARLERQTQVREDERAPGPRQGNPLWVASSILRCTEGQVEGTQALPSFPRRRESMVRVKMDSRLRGNDEVRHRGGSKGLFLGRANSFALGLRAETQQPTSLALRRPRANKFALATPAKRARRIGEVISAPALRCHPFRSRLVIAGDRSAPCGVSSLLQRLILAPR